MPASTSLWGRRQRRSPTVTAWYDELLNRKRSVAFQLPIGEKSTPANLLIWIDHLWGNIQGVFFNWDPPKSSKCLPVSKFWHLELFWNNLQCKLAHRTFRGVPVKKDTLYDFISRNLFLKYLHLVEANRFHRQTPDLCLHRHSRNSGDCAEYDARLWLHGFHNFSDVLRIHFIQGQERYVPGFAHLEEWNLISAYCRGKISSCLRTLLFDGDKRKNAEWQRPWNSYMSYLNTSHTCHTYSWGREGC